MTWRAATLAVWALLALTLVVAHLSAVRRRWGIPTVAAAVRRATALRAGRGALLLVWMWAGWHVFAR